MSRTSISTVLALGLPFALAGCPGPEMPADTGGTDTPGLDAPGTDAPGADVPGTDAPIPSDTPMGTDAPVGCLTGYPALDATTFVSGLTAPVYVTGAPGTTDLFVVEQAGRIRVVAADGTLVATPFLDIRSQVEDSGNEQGLLGLAFAPDYATSGVFYVFYTDQTRASGGSADNVVARGTRMSDRVASPTVEVILRIPDFAGNHNGGGIQFGPDGELYIGTGDGGGGGDPGDNGQDINELLGKMLRIHVASTGAYTIPAGNPFAGATPGADEVFAIGLRNPWRWSFDRGTGDLYIGDVGQGDWEEVDVLEAGTPGAANFGWNTCEGFEGYGGGGATGSPCSLDHHEPAVVTSHGADPVVPGGSQSVIGGYVYRGSAIPGLNGAYLFGDAYADYVAAFRYCDGTLSEYRELDDLSGLCSFLVSFGEDNAGELYMVCTGSGSVMRIVPG